MIYDMYIYDIPVLMIFYSLMCRSEATFKLWPTPTPCDDVAMQSIIPNTALAFIAHCTAHYMAHIDGIVHSCVSRYTLWWRGMIVWHLFSWYSSVVPDEVCVVFCFCTDEFCAVLHVCVSTPGTALLLVLDVTNSLYCAWLTLIYYTHDVLWHICVYYLLY